MYIAAIRMLAEGDHIRVVREVSSIPTQSSAEDVLIAQLKHLLNFGLELKRAIKTSSAELRVGIEETSR